MDEFLSFKRSFIIFIILLVLTTFLLNPNEVVAETIFYEDFEREGALNDWVVARNMQWKNRDFPCLDSGKTAVWEIKEFEENGVKNKRLGIKIDGPGCTTEIIPKNFVLNGISSYVYELEMYITNVDANRNFVFKYLKRENYPKDPDWYGIMVYVDDVYTQKVVNGTDYSFLSDTFSYQFSANKKYKFKVEMTSDHKINVYINDSLQKTVQDTPPFMLEGTIGLQASVGSDPDSEVWFDNVVVRSIDERLPVVFLPGYMAGWNSVLLKGGQADHWSLNTIAYHFVYKNLINSFFDAGYIEGTDFFIFNYDWRKPLNLSKIDLQQFLDTTVNVPKVNLVSHSFGGLVARAYLQDHSDKVERLVTVGSPHQGELRAYAAWEGGEFWQTEPYIKGLGDVLVWRLRQPGESRVETIRRVFPSLQDLLPTFNFLQDPEGSVKNVNTHVWQNTTLNSLNSSLTTEEKNLLKTIFGDGFSTLARIIVESIAPETRPWWDWALGLWEDGKPACPPGFGNECPEAKIFSNEGDETVLSLSATIDGVVDHGLTLTHKDLVKEPAGIEKILDLLGISGTPAQEELALIQKIIFFHLGSPAHLTVTDPKGKKIGYGVLPEIEDALYDEEGELVMIANPLEGEYAVEVRGEDTGDYSLLVGQTNEDGTQFYEYSGETETGQVDDLQFDFEEEEAKETLVDPLGLDHLSSAKEVLLNLRPNLSRRKQRDLDRILKDLEMVEREIEKEKFSRAARWLKRIISRIYSLRRGLDLEKKEELEKTAVDCQAAYLAIVESNGIEVSRFKAKVYLNLAQRYLDRVQGQTKEAALIFLLAQEYLQKAQMAFDAGNYPKALLYSSIARYLASEVWFLSK